MQEHSGFKALGNLDMDSQYVKNLPAPVDDNDAARKVDVTGDGGVLYTVRDFIALRAETSYTYSTSTGWESFGGFVAFDKSKYPNLQSVKFAAKLSTSGGGATAYAILYDRTNSSYINSSEITNTEDYWLSADSWVESGDIQADLASGNIVYGFKLKTSDGNYSAKLYGGYLIVEYKVYG